MEQKNIKELDGKYSLESTDPCESEIRAPPQPLNAHSPNTLFYNKNLSQPFCRQDLATLHILTKM